VLDPFPVMGAGTFISIGVDRNDTVITYLYDSVQQRMFWTDGESFSPGFNGMSVENLCGNCGQYVDFTLDAQNNRHVSYTDATTPMRVKYLEMSADGNEDTIETIESGLQEIGPTSVAVEDGGQVHVAYFFNGAAHYAKKIVSGWQVMPALDGGADVSIVVAGSIPHVVASLPTLTHAYLDGGAFVADEVVPASGTFHGASIAADSAGVLMIAYVHPVTHDLRLATLTQGAWISESVDTGIADPPVTLRVTSTGAPRIAYLGAGGVPRYASKTMGGWMLKTVDTRAASTLSFALDQYDRPLLIYYDPVARSLHYAH